MTAHPGHDQKAVAIANGILTITLNVLRYIVRELAGVKMAAPLIVAGALEFFLAFLKFESFICVCLLGVSCLFLHDYVSH